MKTLTLSDVSAAEKRFRSLKIKNESKLEQTTNVFIGKNVLIIGHHQISQELFDKSWPNKIFGKIIGYDYRKGFLIRTYWRKVSGEKRHKHSYARSEYLKIIEL